MTKSKPRHAKRRKTAVKRSKPRRKTSSRKASRRKAPKRKAVKRKARKRTTAEGMHRALEMKQAAEQREHELHPQPAHNWPTHIPQGIEPDRTPNNIREQGDIANIIQNTTTRRAG